jgi:four helix bundle protein
MNGGSDSRGELDKRLLLYAVRIIGVVHALPKSMIGAHVAKQIPRSGTSGGANYREACGAESRADFVHKMQIVVKELRETEYWLRVSREAKLLPAKRLENLLQETNELIAMSVSSVVTAKGRAANEQDR